MQHLPMKYSNFQLQSDLVGSDFDMGRFSKVHEINFEFLR